MSTAGFLGDQMMRVDRIIKKTSVLVRSSAFTLPSAPLTLFFASALHFV